MLDPRVRRALLDYEAGVRGLEETVQLLLDVRRERGCLEIHAPAGAADPQRRLVERYSERVRAEFGA
jgi:hypothetical protein